MEVFTETNTEHLENINTMESSIITDTDNSEEITSSGQLNDDNFKLNKEKSIDEIFEHYQHELVNKHINMEKDTVVEGEDLLFQATTSERQMDYINDDTYDNNISCIDLFECEETLKEEYGIEEPLIILKLDIKRNDTNSTQVEYQVFNPNTLEKLDLSKCNEKHVNIYTPIDLDLNIIELAKQLKEQDYDLFNSSDPFYNDICCSYTSVNNTDVLLSDRKKDFYIENLTLCEEGCEYEDFDFETNKVKCQCETKLEVKNEEEVKFEPNIIIQNFYKIEKYTNIRVFICYEAVFDLNKIKINSGSYILLSIALLFIIIMIINFFTFKNKIGNFVDKIINEYQNLVKNLRKYKEKSNNKKQNKAKNESNSKNLFYQKGKKTKPFETEVGSGKSPKNILKLQNNLMKTSLIDFNKKKNKNDKNQDKTKDKNKDKKKGKKNEYFSTVYNLDSNDNKRNNKIKIKNNLNYIGSNSIFLSSNKIIKKVNRNKKNNINDTIDKNEEEIIEKIVALIPIFERATYFKEDELNSLEYKYAIQIDFRNFYQFYYSLLKQTHLIIFTFFVRNDYNVFLTKLSLFLLSFSLYMFMNTLFFIDESLHKIYEDEGKYDIFYQIPQMIYSTVSSQVVTFLLEMLSLSQDNILSVKEQKTTKEMKKELLKIIKWIKIKLIIFFVVGIIFLFFFWYYLSAFCAVYRNTKGILIKDSLISYITGMLYPFLFNLFPSMLRIISLRKKCKCLYLFSDISCKIIGIL